MAAIHPMVFAVKGDIKKLEARVKILEDILADKATELTQQEKT